MTKRRYLASSEEKVQRVVHRHALLYEVEYAPAVDHDEEAQQQQYDEDDHVDAGADGKADVVLAPLGVVDGVHPAQERLHAGGGGPQRQQYGHGQRDAAAVIYARDDEVHYLVERLRHVLGHGAEHYVPGERRILQHGDEKHYDRHERHEEVVCAGGRVGGYPPAAEPAEELVNGVIDISERILHSPRPLSETSFSHIGQEISSQSPRQGDSSAFAVAKT